ncbi:MAG: trehalase family glycosidase [Bacteroidota bacterium]
MCPGGLVTTPVHSRGAWSREQWDTPNGWAPLHWQAVVGLRRYGHTALADEVKRRWLALNEDVFERTGKMMEKYDVVDLSQEAGGGEYLLQDGFGWTNGVVLALLALDD